MKSVRASDLIDAPTRSGFDQRHVDRDLIDLSPDGKVTVAVALLFLICGALTVKFCSQPLSQSCAHMKMSAFIRRISLGAFA